MRMVIRDEQNLRVKYVQNIIVLAITDTQKYMTILIFVKKGEKIEDTYIYQFGTSDFKYYSIFRKEFIHEEKGYNNASRHCNNRFFGITFDEFSL